MILTLADVLSDYDIDRVRTKAAELEWRDGVRTAGAAAARVKRNRQANLSGDLGEAIHGFLFSAIGRHPVFSVAARPKRISHLLLSQTEEGGGYGEHSDNALMHSGDEMIRTDLSFTLFLTPPEEYDGGELVISGADGERAFKLAAGDMLLYPSGALHRVAEVTRGARLACVGWVESRIRGVAEREILFDLSRLRASLPDGGETRLLADKTVSNLLRLWAET